jgi:peptidoglycan/xylan/chitin deacetylase (PgdA/CDA1 family)
LKIALIVLMAAGALAQSRTVAITVDDLPSAGDPKGASAQAVNAKLLAAFKRHNVPVTGFVIQKRVEDIGSVQGTTILKEWIKQGLDLGNHT